MTIEEALIEWKSKRRRMGCVSATNWFCNRVPEFYPLHCERWTEEGDYFGHVVATDGSIVVDLTPHLDSPEPEPSREDCARDREQRILDREAV